MGVCEGTVVPDILSSPWIVHSINDTSHTQWNGVGFSHLGYKHEHQERSCVEVSDWELSQKQIASKIGKADFVDGPFSVGSVIVLAAVILLRESLSVVGQDVCNRAGLLPSFRAQLQNELLFRSLEHWGVIIVVDVVALELDGGYHFIIVLINLFLGSEPQSSLGLSDWHQQIQFNIYKLNNSIQYFHLFRFIFIIKLISHSYRFDKMLKYLFNINTFNARTVSKKSYQKFLDIIRAPTGSKIPITQQQKDRINEQIDRRLQELEDTGLSRQQILLSKSQKGLPLKIDPFFQFLKHNRLAREVYLKENQRFTAEKVVDIALRQDIGLDPSYSRIRETNQIEPKGRSQLLASLGEPNQLALDPASYDANNQFSIQRAYSELKKNQPVKHIYKPIDRYEKLKDHLRKLKKYDIHWRNVELLRQFVTKNNNIRNRLTNLLSVEDQNRVMKSIRTARHMGVLPHYGRTPEPLKRNITTLEDEVQQIGYQHINIETGHIYFSRSKSMDSLEAEKEKAQDVDGKYERMLKEGKSFRLWVEKVEKKDPIQHKVEGYARFLKQKENQKTKKKNESNIRERVVKKITGLDVAQQKNPLYSPDGSDASRQAFEQKKEQLKQKFTQNPLCFTDILVNEKIDA